MLLCFFLNHMCVHTYTELYTLTHSPVTFHSAFFTFSLQRGSARARGCSMLSFQSHSGAPDTELSLSRGGEQLLWAPAWLCWAQQDLHCHPTLPLPPQLSQLLLHQSSFAHSLGKGPTSHSFILGSLSHFGNADWGANMHSRSRSGQEPK